ncbi:MAG: hypothetical protein ACRCX2_29015 [Paraclostridium sp.]
MKFVSNDWIDRVINKLSKEEEFKKNDFKELNKILNEAKLEGVKIKYGYLSNCIKNMKGPVRDNVFTSAEKCIYFDVKDENEILMQIINHIILEVPRANDLDRLKDQYQTYSNKVRESSKEQREFAKKMDKFEDKFGNIQGEFIGILSIFSAVIIGFFGGLNVIGSAMQHMGHGSKYRLIFTIVILGLIMFNVIYMLLAEVSKLAGKEKNRSFKYCKTCEENETRNIVKCSINKHPYAFYFNLLSITALIFTYGLYLVDKYNVITSILDIFKGTRNNQALIPVLGSILAIIVLISYIYILNKTREFLDCKEPKEEKFLTYILKFKKWNSKIQIQSELNPEVSADGIDDVGDKKTNE